MKIKTISISVSNQAHALAFYTDILGFVKKTDIPLGGENQWLTVRDLDKEELKKVKSEMHLSRI